MPGGIKTKSGYQIRLEQTTAALKEAVAKKRGNKYHARKCVIDGIVFASGAEGRQYSELKIRERLGEIARLQCHPVYDLTVEGVKIGKLTPDFQYYDIAQKKLRVIEVKSPPTAKKADFRLRKKLFEALYRHELEVVYA